MKKEIFDPTPLATTLHQKTRHSEKEWRRALESAQQSLQAFRVDPEILKSIALASASPASFTVIARLTYQHGKSHPQGAQILPLLFKFVNSYPFSLGDWIDATDYFYRWLREGQRKINFLSMLNYLECCAAAPEAKETGQTLLALIEDMLKHFDYEAG